MAQAVDHGGPVGGPRHGAHAGRRTAHPGAFRWSTLALTGVGLLVSVLALAVLDRHWPDWVGAGCFTVWFVVGVAWADAVRTHWHWAVSIGLGLVLLAAASVLPSTHTPPDDGWAWVVALCAALGTGFALGPVVGAVLGRVVASRER
ncbi:hypothetical protein [Luteimicrobium subarcticum]|uniref:Uncharacterized protein n=1 Tax=Luteimicrobium subarcticum TaxID=620910 RepID=A0A2M8WRT6_9MICO|nr:hypothetical protein [Luteimicrobium subarcticum]PJI93655.1 hypothetical protein CLV34_1129 [Luteimicrobium subarcticum]